MPIKVTATYTIPEGKISFGEAHPDKIATVNAKIESLIGSLLTEWTASHPDTDTTTVRTQVFIFPDEASKDQYWSELMAMSEMKDRSAYNAENGIIHTVAVETI